MNEAPLILTLALDEATQAFFDALREEYFPPERNFLRAHCTLFHALPGVEAGQVEADLRALCNELTPFEMSVAAPKLIGRGVAFPLEGGSAKSIHARLQKRWWERLSPQDRQALWPHITVQNKVAPEVARSTQAVLLQQFSARVAKAEGLQLWRYLGGPWEPLALFRFNGKG